MVILPQLSIFSNGANKNKEGAYAEFKFLLSAISLA